MPIFDLLTLFRIIEIKKTKQTKQERRAQMSDTDMKNEICCIEDLENIIDSYGSSYAYEFDIKLPNGKVAGKVGDTNAPLRRQAEWAKVYKDWFDVHFSYKGTTDIDKDTFFRDYAIHAYGKQHLGWKQVPRTDFPAGEHYTQEAYYGANAQNVAEAIKQLRSDIRSGKATVNLYHRKSDEANTDVPSEPFTPRANQQVCIDNIINAYHNGRHHLLCAAHPRFGKSFTALYALDKIGEINFVMVVSAVADAHDEWKDTVSLPNFRGNWIFLDAKRLAEGTGHDITDAINASKKVVLFCTLQDIEGNEKKTKHEEIYKFASHNSFLIVDETHNGGRGITFSKKIKQLGESDVDDDVERELNGKMNDAAINFGFVNQLHLSGTPYRILLTDEFAPEDIVYMSSYSDLLAEKHAWFIEHADEDEHENPYYEFHERYNFVYDLNQIPDKHMKQFIDEEGIPRLAELFAVIPGENRFVNVDVVSALVKALWGGFTKQGCWGILADKVLNQAVKKFHILMKLPSIAACDAFAALIDDCTEFSDYAVILATSNRQKNPSVKSIKQQIKLADESDETAGTITLTCQRLSAAVSVKQWNVAINASDGKSAQDYDQFAQRVCTPLTVDFIDDDGNTIKQVAKPNVFVIDLVPERILSVSMQAAVAKCAARGVSSPADFRSELEKETSNTMTFLASGIKSLKQVTAVDVMDLSASYAKTSTIDIAVAKVPFCSALFDGDVATIMDSIDDTISSGISFDTKTYEGADDTDVSDKRKKPDNDEDRATSPLLDALNGEQQRDADGASARSADKLRQEQMAKQRTFFARLGYLSVLADSQLDSVDELLEECSRTMDGKRKLRNVVSLSLADCHSVAAAVKLNPVACMAADNLVYNLTRRMNDVSMTQEQKLSVFAAAFSKLGDAEVVTPADVTKMMCSYIDESKLYDVIGAGSRIIDFSSETGEFSLALLRRFEELGVFVGEARRSICAIPASPLAYECTRKAYELLGLDPDNIYRFTVYDLLAAVKSDGSGIDETAIEHVSAIMKQNKKPCDISLDDVVEEGTGKVNIEAIVGNPPYQASDSRARLYPLFYKMSINFAGISILIFPDGWQQPKNANGMRLMNSTVIKQDQHIVFIKDMVDVFDGVSGAKNVNIVYWNSSIDNGYDGKQLVYKTDGTSSIEYLPITDDDIERPAVLTDIVNKIIHDGIKTVDGMITARKPYGFCADPFDNPVKYGINPTEKPVQDDDARLFALRHRSRHIAYIRLASVPKISPNFDSYKVFVPKAWGGYSKESGWLGGSYSDPIVAEPNDCCSETYVEFGPFNTRAEAENANKYLHTKFFRAMFGYKKTSHNTPRATYSCVPLQDFSSSSDIDWSKSVSDIDKQLYAKYNLTNEKIGFIEKNVAKMD